MNAKEARELSNEKLWPKVKKHWDEIQDAIEKAASAGYYGTEVENLSEEEYKKLVIDGYDVSLVSRRSLLRDALWQITWVSDDDNEVISAAMGILKLKSDDEKGPEEPVM